MEKPVTLAKVKPRVPAASSSSPSRPRKAVVIAVLMNQVEFIGINGSVMFACFLSSERMMVFHGFGEVSSAAALELLVAIVNINYIIIILICIYICVCACVHIYI